MQRHSWKSVVYKLILLQSLLDEQESSEMDSRMDELWFSIGNIDGYTEKKFVFQRTERQKDDTNCSFHFQILHMSDFEKHSRWEHQISSQNLARFEKRHRSVGGNALRAAVLGGNDGLVSNF